MYPRLKFVDTTTITDQIIQINEELEEYSKEMFKLIKDVTSKDKLENPIEAIREAHDVCQSFTTLIRMLCENYSIPYEDTFNECVKKGIERNGNRSDRH